MCGNEIGQWAMVAAGAVVTKDVKPHALVMGSPARQVGWTCECGKTLKNKLSCDCGRKYTVIDDNLKELSDD